MLSPGFPWVPLGSPGLPWAPLGFPGLLWAFLGSLGLSWATLLGSPGLPWTRSPGLSWALLGCPPPPPQAPLGSPGLSWVPPGFSWVALGSSGFPHPLPNKNKGKLSFERLLWSSTLDRLRIVTCVSLGPSGYLVLSVSILLALWPRTHNGDRIDPK